MVKERGGGDRGGCQVRSARPQLKDRDSLLQSLTGSPAHTVCAAS